MSHCQRSFRAVFQGVSMCGIFPFSHVTAFEMLAPAHCFSLIQISFLPLQLPVVISSPLATSALSMASFCFKMMPLIHFASNKSKTISWDANRWGLGDLTHACARSPLWPERLFVMLCISVKGLSAWELKLLFNSRDIIFVDNLVKNWVAQVGGLTIQTFPEGESSNWTACLL